MFAKKPLASAIGIASAAGALSAVMAAPVVYAAEGDQVIEEVVVTGSRIAKKDFISNAPVATVGQEQFQLTNAVNTEALLNTLPQAVPGLDRTSNNPGNGTATIDLRGLGPDRTLLLVNGRRLAPLGVEGAPSQPSINTIPSLMIDNVDLLLEGASSVYGSDALAGVINVTIARDFEGLEVAANTSPADGTSNTMMISEQNNILKADNGTPLIMASGVQYGIMKGTFRNDLPDIAEDDFTDRRAHQCTTIRHRINQNGWRHNPRDRMLDGSFVGIAGVGQIGINIPINSAHIGGVNAAYADGSVHFLLDNLDFAVLGALATRDDGLSVGNGL